MGGDEDKAARALRESEARFRALSNATREAVVIHEEGVIWEVNRAFTELVGFDRDQVVGRNGLRMIIAPESREAVTRSMASTGSGTALQVVLVSRQGQRLIVDSYSEPFTYLGRPMRVVTMRDVTARLRAEQERRELEQQLVHSQRMEAIGRLAGGVAHDFNNMLTVVLANANIISSYLPAAHPASEPLGQIVEASQRAAALVRQLLIFARKEIVEVKRVDINRCVEEVAQLLRRVMGEHIALELDLARGLWPVRIDPIQCEQVLMNLAVNARDAMPRGGTFSISTRNVAAGSEPEISDQIELRVSDTGAGMSQETLRRAFEPFFTTKETGRGTGLGLSTCHAVITRSGGTIEAESVPARGTTFVIRLPRAPGERRPEVEAPATAPRAGGHEMILLVEDDPQVRSLTARLLRGWGYRVLPAADPADAVRMAAQHPGELDLILSDIVMPGQSGPELVSDLASTQPRARTLFVSGYPGDEMESFGLREGSLPILAKPYAPDELALRVRQLLDAPR